MSDPVPVQLTGKLIAGDSDKPWVLLRVPKPLMLGLFSALDVPGIELSESPAHISVMTGDEVKELGGIEKIKEIGEDRHFNLGEVRSVVPDGWKEMARCWFAACVAPELEKLRKSYGLTEKIKDHEFHITFAVLPKSSSTKTTAKAAALGARQLYPMLAAGLAPVLGYQLGNLYDARKTKKTGKPSRVGRLVGSGVGMIPAAVMAGNALRKPRAAPQATEQPQVKAPAAPVPAAPQKKPLWPHYTPTMADAGVLSSEMTPWENEPAAQPKDMYQRMLSAINETELAADRRAYLQQVRAAKAEAAKPKRMRAFVNKAVGADVFDVRKPGADSAMADAESGAPAFDYNPADYRPPEFSASNFISDTVPPSIGTVAALGAAMRIGGMPGAAVGSIVPPVLGYMALDAAGKQVGVDKGSWGPAVVAGLATPSPVTRALPHGAGGNLLVLTSLIKELKDRRDAGEDLGRKGFSRFVPTENYTESKANRMAELNQLPFMRRWAVGALDPMESVSMLLNGRDAVAMADAELGDSKSRAQSQLWQLGRALAKAKDSGTMDSEQYAARLSRLAQDWRQVSGEPIGVEPWFAALAKRR